MSDVYTVVEFIGAGGACFDVWQNRDAPGERQVASCGSREDAERIVALEALAYAAREYLTRHTFSTRQALFDALRDVPAQRSSSPATGEKR